MAPLLMAVLALLVLAIKRAFELVLEKEYATWAPALARLLARVASFVYWPRGKQWRADLRYMQEVEHESGLLPAGWCLLSAPWLALHHVVLAFRTICSRHLAVVLAGFLVALAGTVLIFWQGSNSDARLTAEAVESRVMSPFCLGLTLAACPSAEGSALRDQIAAQVAEGWTNQRIDAWLVGNYGANILIRRRSATAFLIPVATVLGFGLAVAFILQYDLES
jgi:cytochrome c-type biogenesis protein CcmH/NrfF